MRFDRGRAHCRSAYFMPVSANTLESSSEREQLRANEAADVRRHARRSLGGARSLSSMLPGFAVSCVVL
jgi:hypothetical protein